MKQTFRQHNHFQTCIWKHSPFSNLQFVFEKAFGFPVIIINHVVFFKLGFSKETPGLFVFEEMLELWEPKTELFFTNFERLNISLRDQTRWANFERLNISLRRLTFKGYIFLKDLTREANFVWKAKYSFLKPDSKSTLKRLIFLWETRLETNSWGQLWKVNYFFEEVEWPTLKG